MKKALCIILIISILSVLIFTSNVFAEGEEVTVDGITYTSFGTYCELTECDYKKSGEVVIPSSVKFGGKSLPVTSIGDGAFSECSGLTSVTIPDSVTSIGVDAFYWCNGLTSVTIPDSVTTIGERAFSYCSGLESINLSGKNKVYHSKGNCIIETDSKILIAGCKNSVIPDDGSVTSIGDHAFEGCSGLTSVTIPDSVTIIGEGAFSYCSGLESINVSGKNKVYHSKENCIIETDSKILIAGCKNSVIPDDGSVTSIGNYAFYGCSGLTSVTIPDSVTSIGVYAFLGCSSLTSVTIPDSVTSIGIYAFLGCSSLTSVTIPDSVTEIGEGAFGWCESLTSITIPDSVTSIGDWAFWGCIGLTSVTIGNGVTSIGEGAFHGCSGLETVYYKGSEDQWNKINIGEDNDYLLQAEKIFDFAEPGIIEINGGDCNGDGAIDNKDVVVLFRYVSGGNKVEDESIYDINGDGEVDNKDVVTLFRYISAL